MRRDSLATEKKKTWETKQGSKKATEIPLAGGTQWRNHRALGLIFSDSFTAHNDFHCRDQNQALDCTATIIFHYYHDQSPMSLTCIVSIISGDSKSVVWTQWLLQPVCSMRQWQGPIMSLHSDPNSQWYERSCKVSSRPSSHTSYIHTSIPLVWASVSAASPN